MRNALQRLHFSQWIGDHGRRRQPRIDNAVDEGGVRAVLEQSAHEVGQQILVRADRCVDTAGVLAPCAGNHMLIELLAHPMQSLKLKVCGARGEQLRHEGNRVRVVLSQTAQR